MRWAILGGLAVALLLAASAQGAPDQCTQITGTIVTTAFSEGCPSPIGLCFSGVLITTDPRISGTTTFVADVFHPSGMQAPILEYQGILALLPADGVLRRFRSHGLVNLDKGTVMETDIPLQDFGLRGAFHVDGTAAPGLTGFSGEVTANLCIAPSQ